MLHTISAAEVGNRAGLMINYTSAEVFLVCVFRVVCLVSDKRCLVPGI